MSFGSMIANGFATRLMIQSALVFGLGIGLTCMAWLIFQPDPEIVTITETEFVQVPGPYEKPEDCQLGDHRMTEWKRVQNLYHMVEYPDKEAVVFRVNSRNCRWCNHVDFTIEKEVIKKGE